MKKMWWLLPATLLVTVLLAPIVKAHGKINPDLNPHN